jgi:hypothetical protein
MTAVLYSPCHGLNNEGKSQKRARSKRVEQRLSSSEHEYRLSRLSKSLARVSFCFYRNDAGRLFLDALFTLKVTMWRFLTSLSKIFPGTKHTLLWLALCFSTLAGKRIISEPRRCVMDAVGVALISTFVLMMIAPVFALSFLKPPKRERFHKTVRSSVIG